VNPYVAARLCRLLEEHCYCAAEVEAVSNDGGRQGAPVDAPIRIEFLGGAPRQHRVMQDADALGGGDDQRPIRAKVQAEAFGMHQGMVSGTQQQQIR